MNPQEFELHHSQAEVAVDRHRFRVLCNGRRWGKTTLALDQMKACAAARPSKIVYIAPTIQQARDIAWEQLKRDCAKAALKIRESPHLEIVLPTQKGGESSIILRGWEAIETLRGQSFDLVVIDEVASMRNFWSHWQEVIRPTLTDRKGEALFISTPKGFNHFYDLFNMQDTDPDYKSWRFPSSSNPHLPHEEIEKAKLELSYERFVQEYEASFAKTEGLVYKEFDRNRHLFNTMTEMSAEVIAGVDFGFTNPCAVITIVRDRTDCYWVTEEFYETGKTDAQVAEYVAAKGFNKVYPDPEAPAAILEMRKRKVNVRDVVKGKDSIKNGIDRVRELLRADKLRIHTSCKNLILEFETYAYPDKKDMHNFEEKPIDESNHALDATRYALVMNSKASSGRAETHYPQSTLPRNNLLPGGVPQRHGAPPEFFEDAPRVAPVRYQKL